MGGITGTYHPVAPAASVPHLSSPTEQGSVHTHSSFSRSGALSTPAHSIPSPCPTMARLFHLLSTPHSCSRVHLANLTRAGGDGWKRRWWAQKNMTLVRVAPRRMGASLHTRGDLRTFTELWCRRTNKRTNKYGVRVPLLHGGSEARKGPQPGSWIGGWGSKSMACREKALLASLGGPWERCQARGGKQLEQAR